MALELYCRGFFEASGQLLDSCATNSGPIDTMFYPAVFLFRHGLELAFKALNAAATERTGKPRPALRGHNLKDLWQAVRDDLEDYVLPFEPELEPGWTLLRLNDVDAVVAELDALDASGEAFRYDRSMRGETHLPRLNSVDLPQLRDVVRFVSGGIIDYIDRATALAESALVEQLKTKGR